MISEHFAGTWSRPEHEFIEAGANTIFHLKSAMTEENEEEMARFMLGEQNITSVIKSRSRIVSLEFSHV
jgi:hypothetical protein